MSEPFIKICGITNEPDALLSVGLGATALGFIFAESRRRVTPHDAQDIIRRLPDGIFTVGVFRDQPLEDVVEIAIDLKLSAVQLHGAESRDDCRFIADQVGHVIKAFVAGDPEAAHFRSYGAKNFLIDGPEPGSGEVFDWRVAESMRDAGAMILSGGLRPSNVERAISTFRPYGVDVCSGVEAEAGRKDALLLREFIHAARSTYASITVDRINIDDEPYDWGNE
jgi:phosphoribosylanthranilate isomerase